MFPFKIALTVLSLLATGVLVSVGAGRWRWARSVSELEALVLSGARDGGPRARGLPPESLPPPVRLFLERSLVDGEAHIVTARLAQEGTFQMGEGSEGWRTFRAIEVFRASEPAFFWDARISMAPGIEVHVLDAYVDGEAQMRGKILGAFTVLDAASEPGLRSGALARYLAEAVWIPTRLAPGHGLTWSAIDDRTAEATLEDRGTVVSLRFTFDDDGDPIGVEGMRGREVHGEYVDTPWRGRFSEHRVMGGFRIPTRGEVAWIIDGVETPYWRGTITSAEFTTGRSARARSDPPPSPPATPPPAPSDPR